MATPIVPGSRAASRPRGAHEASANALKLIDMLPELRAELLRAAELLRVAESDVEAAGALTHAAGTVNAQTRRFRADQAEAHRLLVRVAAQLGDIDAHLTGQAADRQATRANEVLLSDRVLGEMEQIGDSVESATELDSLRREVNTRLAATRAHFKDFRERESARAEAYETSIQRMRAEVGALTNQTTQLRRSLAEEQQAAATDVLTGLPNRAAYEERLAQAFRERDTAGRPLCIAVWDVDRFKSVNDTYGHAAGDRLLRAVARNLQQHQRETDFLARYGGEEFVQILPNTTAHSANWLAGRLRELIAGISFKFQDQPIAVTISCGLARVEDGETPEQAFMRADRALYEAKNKGRNCVVFADAAS